MNCLTLASWLSFICAIICRTLVANPAEISPLRFEVKEAEDYNRLFYRQSGWTGGDVAYSFPLSDGRIAWLFGDSWVGKIRNGRHEEAQIVNNAVAIQRGVDPVNAKLQFYWGTEGGKAAAFVRPQDGVGKLWLSHGGIETEQGLYLFMTRILDQPDDPTAWGFRVAGIVMAMVSNPQASPDKWRIEQKHVPWAEFDQNGNERAFGMPLLRVGNTVYLYGLEWDKAAQNRFLLVGRAPSNALADFNQWEFFAQDRWQRDFRKASRLCDHMGAELSVSFLPALKRYVLIYTENGLSEKIQMRWSAHPEGPWSRPVTIFKTPEPGWDKTYFCYAAKAHPELAGSPDEIVVSYVCNSNNFTKLAGDARIYFPRFLRVKLKPAL